MSKNKTLEYQKLETILKVMSINTHASEVHGAISGFLCLGANDAAASYIQELIEGKDTKTFEQEIRAIVNLLQTVHEQLSTTTFDFHLLLPDDEASLSERAKGISLWCHGFSDSFFQSEVDMEQLQTEEAKDGFFHITEISQLDYEALSVSEEDEKSFVELYEYIRMGVLMIQTEFKKSVSVSGDGEQTIH